MATRLKNIVRFAGVPPAVPAVLPHFLNIEGRAVIPDNVVPQTGGFTVTANATDVTVVNNNPMPADLDVLVEHWHTFERAFGVEGGDENNLVPQPFVLGTGGGGVSSSAPIISFVYRPGGVAGGNVYTSWPLLVAALALAPGLKQIFFDDSIVSPAPIPAGGPYDMTDVAWVGSSNADSLVTVAEGASFTKLRVLQDNVLVTFTGATPPVADFAAGEQFALLRGATIGSTGAGPFVQNTSVGQITVTIQDGSRIENQGTPVLDLGAASTTVIEGLALGQLQAGALSGAVGATVQLLVGGSSASLSEIQPAYAGTLQFLSAAIARHNPTATQVGAYLPNGNDLVRCDPSGGGFNVVLPSAVDRRGQSIVVKNITASPNLITILPQGAETIDGAASKTIGVAFGSLTLESDGVSEWMVTAVFPDTDTDTDTAVLGFGNSSIAAGADTRFLDTWYNQATAPTVATSNLPAPRAGTIRNLFVRHNVAAGNGNSVVYTVMVDGVASGVTVTLATGAVGQASDLVNSVAVAQGQRVTLRAVKALAIGSGVQEITASMLFS